MEVNKFNAFEKIFKYSEKLDYFFNCHKTLITIELDLTNKCNNKCPNCTGIKDNPVTLTYYQVTKLIDDLKSMDCKSVIISGGGEPLLHENFSEILYYIRNSGLKIGLNSNGLALDEEKSKAIIDCCSYFRISLDAGTPQMYKQTHGMNESSYNKVLKNIRRFVELKKELNSDISFGTGYLTGNDTAEGIIDFFRISKACGVDFGQLRPFTNEFFNIDQYFTEAKEEFEDDAFKVTASMHKYNRFSDNDKRPYKKCYGMFFNTVVTADYKAFACLHHRQNDKYFLGNLNEVNICDIWRSARIREVFESIDFSNCPYFCRNDEINRGLDYLSKDIYHKEFL